LDEVSSNTTAIGCKAFTAGSSQLGIRNSESQAIDSNAFEEIELSTQREDSMMDDEFGSQDNPDWYEGNISYFIAQQEVVDNAIDLALSKTIEVESLNQDSSFSPRESVSTTTTPVHPRLPKKGGKGQRKMLTISEKPSMATFA